MRVPAPDYTGRDYDSGLVRIQRLVQSIYPTWTDFNRANFGNTLLRAMAFMLDIASFVADFWARESLPQYARLRRSIQAHSRWIGYYMQGRQAAQATVVFTLTNGVHTEDVTIPAGTQIRVGRAVNPQEFQLLADVTIPAGDTTASGTVEHSENATETETSTGLANQVYKLSQAPFITSTPTSTETLAIAADNGIYTRVDNFLLSTPTDQHFVREVDDEERAIIYFPDGINGKIPEGEIDSEYIVGGGRSGNVEANTITELSEAIVDALSQPIEVSVTNPSAAQGGDDPESLSKAKQSAPAQLRVLNRTVAREDFEIVARSVSGVADCLFLTNDETSLVRENEGVGYIVAVGSELDSGKFNPAAPSQSLLNAVENAWRNIKPTMTTYRVRAVGANGSFFTSINIVAVVYLDETANTTIPGPGEPTVIGSTIAAALADWFAPIDEDGSRQGNVKFGYEIKKADGSVISQLAWSDLFNVVRDTAGVRKMLPSGLTLNGLVEDVNLSLWEYPSLGIVTIYDDSGAILYP